MLKYETVSELVQAAEARGARISEIVLEDQAKAMELEQQELFEKMEIDIHVMWAAAQEGSAEGQRSMSGLTGGEGFRMNEYIQKTNGGLCGPFLGKAMAKALSVAGCNASMGRIVAAPTAGSCGILSSALQHVPCSLFSTSGGNKAVDTCITLQYDGFASSNGVTFNGV